VDYRVYDKPHNSITKNKHFLAMLLTAQKRGFTPECVRYASVDNVRLIRQCGWRGLTRLKANRRVSMDYQPKRAWETWAIAETGSAVHLEGYGLIRVFRGVAKDGDTESWATNDAAMGEWERLKYAEMAWGIEVSHRALKQEGGVERAQVRAARAQRTHPPARHPHAGTRAWRYGAGALVY